MYLGIELLTLLMRAIRLLLIGSVTLCKQIDAKPTYFWYPCLTSRYGTIYDCALYNMQHLVQHQRK